MAAAHPSPVRAARSAHGPWSDPSASAATTAFDEVFCNINLGIISVNRALMLAGSQPENEHKKKKKKKAGSRGGPWEGALRCKSRWWCSAHFNLLSTLAGRR